MPKFVVKNFGQTHIESYLNIMSVKYILRNVDESAELYAKQLDEYVNLPEGDPYRIKKYVIDKQRQIVTIYKYPCKLHHSVCCCLCVFNKNCKKRKEEHGLCHEFGAS